MTKSQQIQSKVHNDRTELTDLEIEICGNYVVTTTHAVCWLVCKNTTDD